MNMGKIYGFILLFILIGIIIISYKKYKDVFAPLCFFSLFQILRYVPGLFSKESEMGVFFTPKNMLLFFEVELLAIIAVCMGYAFHNRFLIKENTKYVEVATKRGKRVPQYLIIILYFAGLFGRIKSIIKSGGLIFVLNNTHEAYRSSAIGSGYASLIEQLMLVGIIMQIQYISTIPRNNRFKRNANIVLCGIMIILSMASYLIFSRRSPALELLMFVVFAYNYLIKNIRIRDLFKPTVLIVISLIVLIIIIMPNIRTGKSTSLSMIDSSTVFDEFSYLGRDTGAYEYFSNHSKWWGKSYYNLFLAPIPSAIMTNKPPVDDGLYLCNILWGYNVSPPMTSSQLPIYNSYPFSTQGIMFANFGIVGVIIGEFIMGILYGRVYRILKDTRSDFMVIVFQLIIYQLELSTLSIVQTLIPLIITFLAFKIFKGIKIVKNIETESSVSTA